MKLLKLKKEYIKNETILRDLDLLIEAHKQLSLALEEPPDGTAELDFSEGEDLSPELINVQIEISHLESLNSAIKLISTCSIPSVASSETFLSSLKLLIECDGFKYAPLINRANILIVKCWDNAILAMERVLERDLVSLEDYLDDKMYKELRDRVLKPFLTVTYEDDSIFDHFLASYSRLRVNSVSLILDKRLNNQFSHLKEDDQILNLIERTRFLMVIERREFDGLFGDEIDDQKSRAHLNKILETIGNSLYKRIDPLFTSLSPFQLKIVFDFVHPLMNSILLIDETDPFAFFLKLLIENHFKSDSNENIFPRKQSQVFNV